MNITRRQFSQTIGLATLGVVAATPSAEAGKRVRLGFVGVGGRGTYLMQVALGFDSVEVPAICDIKPAHLERALKIVEKARGTRPADYSDGPTDYRRLLARDDLDGIVIGTPMPDHAPMSVDTLNAKKHVLSEVSGAMTMDECWSLVRAAESSGKSYMLAENCCYYRQNLMILQMIKHGLFGDLTYAECGYVHDCRAYAFEADGSLTWRGAMSRDYTGNLYPTHSLGPVAQWLGINRGDRLVSLTACTSASKGMERFIAKKFPSGHPARNIKFAVGDTTTTLIRTARGAVVDLRYDTISARPHPSTTYYTLQGVTASYKDDGTQRQIWLENKSQGYAWDPLENYASTFEHPLWKTSGEKAAKTGHGGADYFVMDEFLDVVRTGRPASIDAYDSAVWSCIMPLSAASIRAGGAPQAIPDFTGGAWEKRKI